MKKQVCVRTYPGNYINTTEELQKYLNAGYTVVMCSTFEASRDQRGNEYILERDVEENDR